MEASVTIQIVLNCLGLNSYNYGKCSAKVILFNAQIILLFTFSSLYIKNYWNDLDKTIKATNAINIYGAFVIYSFVFAVTWKKFFAACTIIFQGIENTYPYEVTDERKNLVNSITKEFLKSNKQMCLSVIIYDTAVNILTLMSAFSSIITAEDFNTIEIENLPLILPVYYPPNFRKLYVYFMWYLLQLIFMSIISCYSYIITCVPFLSMKIVVNDIKLLCLTINELDYVTLKSDIKSINNQQNYQNYVENNNLPKSKYDENIRHEYSEKEIKFMKDYLVYIIKYHQLIYRKILIIEKGIQAVSVTFKATAAFVCCTSIYFIVKWENLRKALYGSQWLNKPKWFKKMLSIVISFNNKPMEVKPHGLFVLNLRNYATTINATYSYYNLLNNFKNN
ncbi:uncharacterized protein LOC142319026 isoform X2 [Lycorma delicatula]|uniref:uncharacterized protein LOC142319026 isoform X2 n=1 Tax=Lycorma delicatula TaxID=130591 RepID=UPI003F518BD8